jgi:hypothetical protein
MLLAECELGGVELVLNARGIEVERDAGGFRVACSQGEFAAGALVVATGGLSIPKMGATGMGYELARQLGLEVVMPRAALVPLVLGGDEAGWMELAGVSAEVVAWVEKGAEKHASGAKAQDPIGGSMYGLKPVPFKPVPFKPVPFKAEDFKPESNVGVKTPTYRPGRFREKMLATHRGLSGPAVLQASSYWQAGDELVVDLAPGRKVLGALMETPTKGGVRRDQAALKQALREVLPQRLAEFVAESGAPAGWSNAALEECERRLHRWALHPVGTEGFEKAEVTAGGVNTDGLHARTMEARTVPGLFFIGEALDVTGQLGGFNFQWAWASGVAAGRAV